MGKTGSVEWVKVKNRKGKIRLVPRKNANKKRPGPAQRYDSSGKVRRKLKRSENAIAKSS